MNKEDLIIGVHGSDNMIGGHYNVLGSFTAGLLKGFQNNGIKAYTALECYEKGLTPNLTIGINVTGYESWPEYLKHGIPTIMWSFDSIFYNNIEAVEKFSTNPNFILFNVSPSDNESLNEFFPSLKHGYFPHCTDLNIWTKKDVKKEYDAVFMASIGDYKARIEELKTTLPKALFEVIMMFYTIWISSSNLSFWQLYQLCKKENDFNFNLNQYNFIFKNLVYLVSWTKRAQMIEKLKDFNVKVYGDGPWENYIRGNVQHMGKCDFAESIDIINKSKIVLHNQPSQLTLGLHERILNASATETFVMSTDTLSIKQEFGDNFGYYNDSTYENLEENVQYYLTHEEDRIIKAQKASKIVAERHTWDARARQIINMIQ